MNLNILRLRKNIYKNLKKKAYSLEEFNTELDDYLSDQTNSSKRNFQDASFDQLSKQVLDASVTYLGDFHTFDQNIRNALRIIRFILTQNKDVTLALEMVAQEHQLYLDAYAEGHLTDLEFLDCINYQDSWKFPWVHYKLIFEIVKKHQIKVLALNTRGSLKQRDQYAANLLGEHLEENPNSALLVFYGELHITKNKIPALMETKIPGIKQVIIHQNLDEVYWKLIKKNQEQGLVSFTENEFCLISAPPWIKYESMIYWYENLTDDPDFDIHEYIIETGAKTFTGSTEEDFQQICTELCFHLSLDFSHDEVDDFSLYDHTNLGYVREELEENLSPTMNSFYKSLIEKNKSFRFPGSSKFYCSSYSMNRISYLAGVHIFHLHLDQMNISDKSILHSKSFNQKLLLFTYQAMFGFFFSKIINPHRKCSMYLDIDEKEELANKHIILNILSNKFSPKDLTGLNHAQLYEIAEFTGHILGEYLYSFFKKNNQKNILQDFIFPETISNQTFKRLRKKLLSSQDYMNHRKRYF